MNQSQPVSLPERTVRLAMGQMLVEGGKPETNMERALSMIERAASAGADVIVLPECLDLGWTHPSARTLAEPIPGPRADLLLQAASGHGIYVVAGLTERDGDRVYNAAVLCSPGGEILIHYRKINVLTIAQDLYSIGDRLLVAHTPLGTIGVNICADNFQNCLEIGHSLARMGAQMILSPSAWAHDAQYSETPMPNYSPKEFWTPGYAHIARSHRIPVVGVTNVGPVSAGVWGGRVCCGSSLAVGADGTIKAEGDYGVNAEQLLHVELDIFPRTVTGTAIEQTLIPKNEASG